MKVFRIILVNVLLFTLILFLSFASIYVYQNIPEVHNLMNSMDKNMNLEYLWRQSFHAFGMILLNIYSFYFLVFYLLFKQKPTTKMISFTIIIILIVSIIGVLIDSRKVTISGFSSSVLSTLILGSIGLGARALVEYFNEKDAKKELEKKNLQSELGLLRSQINPHFLFNTLNNIDALIRKDPEKASEILIKLSVQMRYMLYDSNTESISLASEIEFIKDFVILHKLRFKNERAVVLTIDGNPDGIAISPMLFISFIENAFKHCTDKETNNAITIDIAINSDNVLHFRTVNIYNPDKVIGKDSTGGIGLDLVKKRLELVYKGKYNLNINQENNLYKVDLKINLG